MGTEFRTWLIPLITGSLIATYPGINVPAASAQTGTAVSLNSQTTDVAVHKRAPTFYADVLPILQENCQACHREEVAEDGGLSTGFHLSDLQAPMALQTYEQVKPWSRVIALAVKERTMPPFAADVQHKGIFRNERYLEDSEIATIVAWAEQGAPAGDPAQAPPPPPETLRPAGSWAIGEPDLVVQFPEPFCIADNVIDMYVDKHIPISREDHPEPRWIKVSQLAPGPWVHHLNNPYLGTVTPGRGPNPWPEGFGILLPVGETLAMDMHYHKFETGPGSGGCDQTSGAFIFWEEGAVINYPVETSPSVGDTRDLLIPAGDHDYTFSASRVFEEDTYLLSTSPHMHLRGKAAKLELEYPDGRMETLLSVPNYDFRWQHKYDFKEPVFMPAGSRLHMTGWWDNSADNPDNPDPSRDIGWGLTTTDEMLTGRYFYAKAKPIHHVVGDPIPEELFPEHDRWERLADGEITHLVTTDGLIIGNEREADREPDEATDADAPSR